MLSKDKIILKNKIKKFCDVIIRNAYPIAKYHMLYLPFYHENKPQYLNSYLLILKVIKLVLKFNDDDFVMGYNSKGAASSINSLHFQILYLKEFKLNKQKFYFENSSFIFLLHENENFKVSFHKFNDSDKELVYFFKYDFNFEVKDSNNNEIIRRNRTVINLKKSKNLKKLKLIAEEVFKLIDFLNKREIPYNIIFFRNKVLVFPRKNQALLDNISIGFCEWLGINVFYDKNEFINFNEDKFKDNYFKTKLSNNSLANVLNDIKSIYQH